MSFLIVIYCILATRQANGSCLQQLSKRFRCSQAIIGNSWQIRVRALVFNATINNISVISVAVTFIGGGKCSTQRKPPTCLKSLTNFITLCCMEYTTPWAGSKFTLGVIDTDCIGSCKSNYQTWSRQPWSNVVKFAYNKLMGTQETCSL